MKELLISILHFFGWAWWIEVVTQSPRCTYYFGPFFTGEEAHVAKAGYLEDLEQEGAQGIAVNVKRCKPAALTIDEEPGERFDPKTHPTFSGQLS